MTNKVVAVFGGSRVAPGSAAYDEAYAVGKLLASSGYSVLNGGYSGTMEASARGAKEGGGHVIGVISGEFGWLKPNEFLDETFVERDLFDRIRNMQKRSDAFVVLNGSMGTIAELALVWNLSKIDPQQRKPIVLLGDAWECVVNTWRQQLAVTDEEAKLLFITKSPGEVLDYLSHALRVGSDPLPRSPSP